MIEHRQRAQLGRTEVEGLRSEHHFCFASYQDPARMEWGKLRLLSLHRLATGASQGPVHHFNMDIALLPLEGSLAVQIEGGAAHDIDPGDLLHVASGTGISHRIVNRGDDVAVYVELWFLPGRSGKARVSSARLDWRSSWPVASGFGGDAKLRLRSDALLSVVRLKAGMRIDRRAPDLPWAYAALLSGVAHCGDVTLTAGDAAAIEKQDIWIEAVTDIELILIETS